MHIFHLKMLFTSLLCIMCALMSSCVDAWHSIQLRHIVRAQLSENYFHYRLIPYIWSFFFFPSLLFKQKLIYLWDRAGWILYTKAIHKMLYNYLIVVSCPTFSLVTRITTIYRLTHAHGHALRQKLYIAYEIPHTNSNSNTNTNASPNNDIDDNNNSAKQQFEFLFSKLSQCKCIV